MSAEDRIIALAASAAQLAYDNGDGFLPLNEIDVIPGAPFTIALLIPTGVESGDGRTLLPGSLTRRDLPLPLLWQPQTGSGHDGSYIVGRIDSCDITDKGIENAKGFFDTGPFGREAERLVRNKMMRGVSADLDNFEVVDEKEMAELADESKEDLTKKLYIKKARAMGATLLPKPAFQECIIVLDEDLLAEEIPVVDGIFQADSEFEDAAEAAISTLIASAIPVQPPREWFDSPKLKGPTPLTVDEDGRVFGHIATWAQDHIGYNYGVQPPRSRSNYAYFHTGLVRTDTGEDVTVGQLTSAGGHAPLNADAAKAAAHYDNTASAFADVHAGEDAYGIWVAGALRPGITPEQVRIVRASSPSGDWRPINNVLEMVAVCQVNVPGFPITRACVASGSVTALVAAGARNLYDMKHAHETRVNDRLLKLEMSTLEKNREAIRARFAPDVDKRRESLIASAANARAKFAPELERKVQEQNALVASAAEARQRVSEFKLSYQGDVPFDEKLHPRTDEGKFRKVLAKLNELIHSGEEVNVDDGARSALKRASDLEDSGDIEGAKEAAKSVKATLDHAADNASDTAKSKIAEIIGEVANAIESPDAQKKLGKEIDSSALDEGLRRVIEELLDELYEKVDPESLLDRAFARAKAWLDGSGFESPEELAKLIAELLQKKLTPGFAQ